MDLRLSDAVAVVAGSSQGIGRAIAESFAREGARVVINGRDEEKLRRTASELAQAHRVEIEPVVGDLARTEDCSRLISTAISRFGAIHALVTNTGGPPSRSFAELSDDEWQAAVDLLLMSTVRLTRHALPALRRTSGSIVNITSISVKQPVDDLVLSNTIRPAVVGLGKTLANELAPTGVRVNNVAPGYIWTERQVYLTSARAQSQGVPVETVRQKNEAAIPLGRYGTPEEVADLVVFLCSPRAAYITGTTILVDGAIYKGFF